MTATDVQTPTYGHWRPPQSAGVYGLGAIGTGILLTGGIVTVITERAVGLLQAAVAAVVTGLFLLLLLVKDATHGRSGLARLATRLGWTRAARAGANLYRSGPLGLVPHGRHQLPGLLAGSTLTEHTDSWGERFGLISYPATGDHVVVFTSEPDGAALVDPDQVHRWVATWGGYLAMLGGEPGLVGAQVVIETAPDSGVRLAREVEGHVDPDAPAVAQAILREIVETYPVGSATVKAWIALTFSASTRTGGKRRSTEQVARDLAIRLPGLRSALAATGAGAAHLATAADLCEEVRVAYDPQVATALDAARAAGEPVQLSWDDVGPTAAHATWDTYRHDSGVSRSWEMSSAPAGEVYSSVLEHLLDAHPGIDRKRVALLYRPHAPGKAAKIVESDKNHATSRVRESGRRLRQRDVVAMEAAVRTAAEEARGAGLVNFGMAVTATVTDPARLPDAVAAIDNLASTARVVLRPVFGSQDSAFAFTLPVGAVPIQHLAVPSEFREYL